MQQPYRYLPRLHSKFSHTSDLVGQLGEGAVTPEVAAVPGKQAMYGRALAALLVQLTRYGISLVATLDSRPRPCCIVFGLRI